MDRLKEIEARLLRITLPPWRLFRHSGEPLICGKGLGLQNLVMQFAPFQLEDAKFIANAPEDIRFLLTLVREGK